jgi:adenine-specific DNA-methyltransferase
VATKLQLTRKIRELAKLSASLQIDARTLIGTVLRLWCKQRFPLLPHCTLPYSKQIAQEHSVKAFAALLECLELLEATFWLSSLYAEACASSTRRRLALFFTPPALCEGVLDDLASRGVDFATHNFIDPACGGAAFLAPIAGRMRSALQQKGVGARKVLRHIESHLRGMDIDASLCALSKHFLLMVLYEEIQATGLKPNLRVEVGESLTQLARVNGIVDVVVCNPPYRKMATDETHLLASAFRDVMEAQPNLYGLFIRLSVGLIRESGHAALVTPTSFLSGKNFTKVRAYLRANTSVEHVAIVSRRPGVFIGVQQETALTIVRRRSNGNRKSKTCVSAVSQTGRYRYIGKTKLAIQNGAWIVPRSQEDLNLLLVAGRSAFRLVDYGYRARVGGYVWNRDQRPRYASIGHVERASTATAMPLLWSRNVSSGRLTFDGSTVDSHEHPFVDLGDVGHPMIIRKPSVVVQRVSSNTQARRLVAAAVPKILFQRFGGFVGENHLIILEQQGDDPALGVTDLAELLGTPMIDRCFRCISGVTNVSVFELEQLPLPNPQLLKHHLRRGHSIHDAARLSLLDLDDAARN